MFVFGTDFDDTLYFHDGVGIRQEDIDAIRRFKEAGHQFGLVSGRGRVMWPELVEMSQGKVDFDFRIFSNGACICDKDNNILYQIFLPEEAVRDIWTSAKEAGVDLILHGEEKTYTTDANRQAPGDVIERLEDLDPARIYAISFDNTTPEGKAYFDSMEGYDKAIMVSNSRFADFNPHGATKGAALNRLAHMMHESEDISAAIGDSFNDLSMLKDADISFTFASSPQEVQEAASYITDGVHEAVDLLLSGQAKVRTH